MDTAGPSAPFPAPAGPKRTLPLPSLPPQKLIATQASTVESTPSPATAPAQTGPKLEVSFPRPAGAMADRVKSLIYKREKELALIPVKLEQQEPADEQHPFPPTPGESVTMTNPTGTGAPLPLAPKFPEGVPGNSLKRAITPKIPDSGNMVLRIPRPQTAPAEIKSGIRPRFFLELCSGPNHPLSSAIRDMGLATLSPLDFHEKLGGKDHDLLDPRVVELILRLARGGAIVLCHAGGPCGSFSRVRLIPGGPPPVRTDLYPGGIPNPSPAQKRELDTSEEIHRNIIHILRTVRLYGGATTWETSFGSFATKLPFVEEFLRESESKKVIVSTCAHAVGRPDASAFDKNFEFWVSDPSLEVLDKGRCPHKDGFHRKLSGRKPGNKGFIVTESGEYPKSVCGVYAGAAKHFLDLDEGRAFHPWEAVAASLSKEGATKHLGLKSDSSTTRHLIDGGGLHSQGSWYSPPSGIQDRMVDLRKSFLEYGVKNNLHKKLVAHTIKKDKECPFSEDEIAEFAMILAEEITCNLPGKEKPGDVPFQIDAGQPFLLNLLEDLVYFTADQDTGLVPLLRKGVPTGWGKPIALSGVFPPKTLDADAMGHPLIECEGNWKKAQDNPQVALQLVKDDIADGFVKKWEGSIAEARDFYPGRFAVGKLGVVMAEGKQSRLTLDTTVNGVNPGAMVSERVQNPSPTAIAHHCEAVGASSSDEQVAFTIDISKAHKRVRLEPQDHGLMFFQLLNVIYYYVVCHFGGTFSAYWWGRVASLLLRLVHKLIYVRHGGWVYVDDFSFLFPAKLGSEFSLLVVMFLVALGVPISWAKLQFGKEVLWLGLTIDLRSWAFSLTQDKLNKACHFLALVQKGGYVPRKTVESGVGLLLWLAQVVQLLRPWLSEFYSCLSKGQPCIVHCTASQLAEIADSIDENLVMTSTAVLSRARAGMKLVQINHKPVPSQQAARAINMASLSRTWVCLQDPKSLEVAMSKEAQQSAAVWEACISTSCRAIPFLNLPCDASVAAADAFADETEAGIGGWISRDGGGDPSEYLWFQLKLGPELFPSAWGLNSNPQRNIAFYELIAQVALIFCRKTISQKIKVSLRHLCDNLGDVASANKLFSTKPPVRFALQLLSAYLIKFHCTLELQHISGNLNDIADELSRFKDMGPRKLDPSRQIILSVQELIQPFFDVVAECAKRRRAG